MQICGAAGLLSAVLMIVRTFSYNAKMKQAVCRLESSRMQQLVLMSCCLKTQTRLI